MSKRPYCSVKGCKISARPDLKVFQVPRCFKNQLGIQRRQKWLHALGLPPNSTAPHLQICSKHFCTNDFEVGFKNYLHLKPDAVPHLHVPNQGLCNVKYRKRLGEGDSRAVVVPTRSISALIDQKRSHNDQSVYLVEDRPEMKLFTEHATSVPILPKFTKMTTEDKPRDVTVALPGSKTTFPLCRICSNPVLGKKWDPVEDSHRNDVKTVKSMLSVMLPTCKWEMYKNPAICDPCTETVKKTSHLIQAYISTTEALNNLFENTKKTVPPHVDLVIMRKSEGVPTQPTLLTIKRSGVPVPVLSPAVGVKRSEGVPTPTVKRLGVPTSTVKRPGVPTSTVKRPGPVVFKRMGPELQKKIKIIKTPPDNHHRNKQIINMGKRTQLQQRQPTVVKSETEVKKEKDDKTFCCCVCYETFPDSRTLMYHLDLRECTGPRQKSDIVIVGL